MRRVLCLLLVAAALAAAQTAAAQRRVGAVYYDTGGLHDTIPSPLYDDGAYTPEGRMHWNTERYAAATGRLAALLDTLAMPIVGLCGVENGQVALDVAGCGRGDYCVAHRPPGVAEGRDLALLYHGDRFLPGRVEAGHGWLGVAGMLDGYEVAVLLFRCPRCMREVVGEWRKRHPGERLLVMGAADGCRSNLCGLQDVLRPAERRGRGNLCRVGGWLMADRIWADTAWRVVKADVYVPFRRGGAAGELPAHCDDPRAGRKLPVFVYLDAQNLEK